MVKSNNLYGLTLGGGGVKGFAYIGVFRANEEYNISWGNMAGVSAGALAVAINASGYDSCEFQKIVDTLNPEDLQLNKASSLPIVERYRDFIAKVEQSEENRLGKLFAYRSAGLNTREKETNRRNILNDIITFSKDKALFDGDYLEEWIYDILARKGVKTFGDLKSGIVDNKNPKGYKIRMTCVDCTRAKTVVLPDDLTYYGIEPDDFEVAKAVRISISIPFAFKPVIIKKDGISHFLIDGGIFDNFPYWLIDNSTYPSIGFNLKNEKQNNNFQSSINIVKNIVASLYNIKAPKHSKSDVNYIETIMIPNVSTLDFNISEETKNELIESGYKTASNLFGRIDLNPVAGFLKRFFA